MEIRHLEYFLKAADMLSFTRAAATLRIAQSTLSHQIKQLEHETGPLFDRTGRSVCLTSRGKLFRSYAERALNEVHSAVTALSELESLARGQLTMGVYRSISSSYLPQVLAEFHSRHPAIKLRIHSGEHADIETRLLSGELDLAVAYGPAISDKLLGEQIYSESLALIVGEQHPQYGQVQISLKRLGEQSLVLVGGENRYGQLIHRWLSARGISPRSMVETNSMQAALAMVHYSQLATICSTRTSSNIVGVHPLRLPDPALRRTTVLLWRRDSHPSRAASIMARMIKATYASLPRHPTAK